MSPHAASITAKKWTASVQMLDRRLEAGEEVPLSQGQDLRKQHRDEEENLRIYRRACDIWLRLTVVERNAIRTTVINDDPFFMKKQNNFLMENRCIGLIKDHLKQSKGS